jgi:hypothetical protein
MSILTVGMFSAFSVGEKNQEKKVPMKIPGEMVVMM